MKDQFFDLVERLCGELQPPEILLCNFSGERSDFVRFNEGKVRQAGSVEQRFLAVRLVRNRRQASATVALAGNRDDFSFACAALARLRDMLPQLPEDPWLAIAEARRSTTHERHGTLRPAEEVATHIVQAAHERDLVGFYAGGTIYRGFGNSLGQRNWHAIDTFNLDWSLYLRADKAVKTGYAGFDWDTEAFDSKLDAAREELALLDLAPRVIEPDEYRAYVTPRALEELVGLLCWGGFSARARATHQSPLLRMEHGAALSRKVTVVENVAGGVAPAFQDDGYVKPASVVLVGEGQLGDPLVSPRSAKEYGLTNNAANGGETPESLEMAAGALPLKEVLVALDTGLYVSNLWYLNFSDRPAGRITGMTRFATFWVENGRIVAPVNVMRFDDTIFRILGDNLIDFTRERELLLDTSTYEERSTRSARLPGALLSGLRFTL